MINIITKTLRSSFLILAFSLILSFNAIAQTCGTPPTCESLGYILAESKCRGVASLKCPFDQTKYYCSAPLMLGDILYSDKSFSSNLVASKTPIGIIFDIENRLALAFDIEYKLTAQTDQFDFPDRIPGVTEDDGKSNTRIILAYTEEMNKAETGRNLHYPTVEYASGYSTPGTSKGDWFLPSAVEAGKISANVDAIKIAFTNAKKDTSKLIPIIPTSTIKANTCEIKVLDVMVRLPMVSEPGYPTVPVIKF